MASIKLLSINTEQPKPALNPKYKNLAKKRHNQKKIFQESEDVSMFLSAMGHNLGSAILMPNKRRREVSQNKQNNLTVADSNTSTWNAGEESVLEDIEEGENPFEGRRFGITKKGQARRNISDQIVLAGKNYPSCGKGFNKKFKNCSFPLM